MKYKAGKLSNGNYAVMCGSKYFTSTVTESKEEAEQKALKMSAIWYMNKPKNVSRK